MATNEKTSKKIAKLAGEVLSGKWDCSEDNHPTDIDYTDLLHITYALAGSVLTQVADKPKSPAKTKRKKK